MQKYNLFLAVSSDFSLSIFNEYSFICHLTFQQARPRPTCAKLLVWFSKLGLNWPAGPFLDQSFWQWNRLFSRAFAEKPSPSCALFRILYRSGWRVLIKLIVKLSLRREGSGRSVLKMKRPKASDRGLGLVQLHLNQVNVVEFKSWL